MNKIIAIAMLVSILCGCETFRTVEGQILDNAETANGSTDHAAH